jgi:hypothetical protein
MKIKKVAKKLEKMGTKGDTVLAHINEDEAAMLKSAGGSGKRNPKTGLLSFSYDSDSPGGAAEGVNGADFGDVGGGGGINLDAPSVGKPGEDAMAQAAAAKTDMTPDAYAGLQQSMIDAMGTQYSGIMNSILGGMFGLPGAIGGKLGLGDKLSGAFAQNQVMETPYGSSTSGGLFGGDGVSAAAENEHGGALTDNPAPATGAPATPPASLFTFAPVTQQPFVSKWGKPRTRGYFGS